MRYAIASRVRLAVTLRYLATGDSFRSLEFLTYISRKTISKFLPEVLEALIAALQDEYLKTPTAENEWLDVANDFEQLWQFPHTLDAIEGKHILVDAHSRFIYVDIGANGRASDVMAFKNSSLHDKLARGQLSIPADTPLKGQ
ncbi:uncharacterized protein LOC118754434, partial [Rhagoletis pomonella]|uniref:uncharacterized protein LOC118754434 n=1 Tax=Rhagoletis pomonella TaxID=28610 RepID=UPI00177EBA09